jgi:hypothetical protein
MPIDASIPLQAKGIDVDPMGALQKATTMSQLAKQGQMQDEKHKVDMDRAKVDQYRQHLSVTAQLAGSSKDQASWTANLAKAREMGIPGVDKMPEQFDPGFVRNLEISALTTQERLDQQNKERGFDLQEKQLADNAQERRLAYGLKLKEVDAKTASGENLPIDAKKEVTDLASKNAGKIAIRNQISSVMDNWDNMSEDQQIYAGQQLIKTLNSTEGQDAVGNQERDVLAGKLGFALGNFTNGNPTQFGRDLAGFKEQAKNVVTSIDGAVKSNKGVIDERMGRTPKQQASAPPPAPPAPKKGDMMDGYVFMGGDAKDPGSWKKASNVAKGK